jgi:hypothetical protein
MAERSEFELPVPVSKLSYDSIMLGFAIETDCEALLPRTAFLARFSFCRWKGRSQNGAASLWNPAAESVAVWRMPEKASLERCDSSAEPALAFRTIRATRLSVANYNTTLSSESLETGTGSSNSLPSASQSVLFRRSGGAPRSARCAGGGSSGPSNPQRSDPGAARIRAA